MTVAVLLTTFNRKQITLSCLEKLKNQEVSENVHLKIFLTDDGSSDGTADAVRNLYPDVNVYLGDGAMFWAGGMRNSWKKALSSQADYYLLLNDDTILTKNAVSVMLNYYTSANNKSSKPAICIGSTVNQYTGKISYGGRRLNSKVYWNKGYFMHSETEYLNCDVANANIMLVPWEIVNDIGILSDTFTHGLADYDYTLKAKKAGYDLVVAPGFLGSCVDDHGNNWKSGNTSLKERIVYLKNPKGLAYKEYLSFIKEHFPLSYPSAFLKLWIKTLFPFLWDTLKKQGV